MRTCLTLGLMLMTSVAVAGEQARRYVSDVALQKNGLLMGQVLTTTGAAQVNSQVALAQNGKVLAVATTDGKGDFAFAGVRPGIYEVKTAYAGSMVGVWAAQVAPPIATDRVVIVGDANVVRGQLGGEGYGPAIRGAVVGGAIAAGTYWALDYNEEGS